jgi:hypothetical protein
MQKVSNCGPYSLFNRYAGMLKLVFCAPPWALALQQQWGACTFTYTRIITTNAELCGTYTSKPALTQPILQAL